VVTGEVGFISLIEFKCYVLNDVLYTQKRGRKLRKSTRRVCVVVDWPTALLSSSNTLQLAIRESHVDAACSILLVSVVRDNIFVTSSAIVSRSTIVHYLNTDLNKSTKAGLFRTLKEMTKPKVQDCWK
jgi:hypothetical protein